MRSDGGDEPATTREPSSTDRVHEATAQKRRDDVNKKAESIRTPHGSRHPVDGLDAQTAQSDCDYNRGRDGSAVTPKRANRGPNGRSHDSGSGLLPNAKS
jgi:hypothetical protein